MLEAASLLIHAWRQSSGATSAWVRPVQDADSLASLGRVQWSGPPANAWFRQLRGHRLDVLETDDAALLMSLVRPWGWTRTWDLRDAEDRMVGTVYPPLLLDNEGGRRGHLNAADRGTGEIVDGTTRVLAEFARQPDAATQLRFGVDLEPNPFLRMLLLGAVLVQEPPPVT